MAQRWPPTQPAPQGPPQAPNQQWWNAPRGAGARPGLQPLNPGPRAPPALHGGHPGGLRLLGILRYHEDPHFSFFEHQFLLWVRQKLTRDWKDIQCGHDLRAKNLWIEIFQHLELDDKAIRDLLLLAHLGTAGRAEANEVLWNLLSVWALKREYKDLSHKVTNLVGEARQSLERPPAGHRDRGTWRWQRYWEPRHERFSPLAGPQGPYEVMVSPSGVPLPPPQCWRLIKAGPAGPPGP